MKRPTKKQLQGYDAEGRTLAWIGDRHGMTVGGISSLRKRLGLPPRKTGRPVGSKSESDRSKEARKAIARLIRKDLTYAEILAKVDGSTPRMIAQEKNRGESQRKWQREHQGEWRRKHQGKARAIARAEKIRKLIDAGLSQVEVARALDLHPNTVWKILHAG